MENEKKNNVNYNKVNKNKEVIAKDIPEEVKAKNEPEKETAEPAPPKKVYGIVKAPLNLRAAANVSAGILTVMPTNAQVAILEENQNGFYKIKYNEFEGYAMSKFITKK